MDEVMALEELASEAGVGPLTACRTVVNVSSIKVNCCEYHTLL